MPLPGPGRPRFNPRKASEPGPAPSEPPPPAPSAPPQNYRLPVHKKRRVIRAQASSGMDPQTLKYLIFFLIFVVGNAILFFSTGFIIIPR
jgi:hypothetical protein